MKAFYTGKRILVTGGAGFIGARLVERLRAEGAVVTSVDRADGDLAEVGVAVRIIADVRPDIIFNLASTIDTGGYDIARSVIDVARSEGIARLIQFGSMAEYGAGAAPFTEGDEERPYTPYGEGKLKATHAAIDAGYTVVRPAAVYGPGQGPGMLIPNLIRTGLAEEEFRMNPGEHLGDFVYVDDVIDGAMRAGAEERAQGEVINLGSGQGSKIRDVVEVVRAALNGQPVVIYGAEPYRAGEPEESYLDSSKALELLGWKATTSLEDGVATTAAWYRTHTA